MIGCSISAQGAQAFPRLSIPTAIVSILVCAGVVTGQPVGWSVQDIYPPFWVQVLRAVNMATSETEVLFQAPPGVRFQSGGVLSPDGRFYLLATNVGIARFHTTPPSFDRIIGPSIAVTSLAISPTGRRLHAMGQFGHGVLDWETGQILRIECCQPRVFFTPDGGIRLHVQALGDGTPQPSALVTAFRNEANQPLWEITLPGRPDRMSAGAEYFAMSVGAATPEVIILDVATGEQRGALRVAVAPAGLAWRGQTLLVHRAVPLGTVPRTSFLNRLSAYTLPSLSETVLVETLGYIRDNEPRGVFVSGDGRYAYLLSFTSYLGISVSETTYTVADLDTSAVVSRGGLGPQDQRDLTLEASPHCLFDVPRTATAPLEGGIVGIPVVPAAGCGPWSVSRALNPGPHTGATTILFNASANVRGASLTLYWFLVGRQVAVDQPSGVPAAPVLDRAVSGNHVTLTWEPTVGAGITEFIVRGAVRGGTQADVVTISGESRTWTSPPLPPGSYDVEVVAANYAGRGPASNRVAFSIGVATIPDAPENLSATVADDRIALAWRPAATGPSPAGFVVEGAPATGGAFVPVARTDGPPFVITRAPIGSWRVRVRGATAGGVGPPSNETVVTATACSTPPGRPQNPWVLFTQPSVTVRWSAPATGSVETYVLEMGSRLGAADLGRVSVAGDRLSITHPSFFGRVFVRIRARNACGESAPTSDVSVTTS
jgi:hypothetical protein